MRTIKKLDPAVRDDIADLVTHRALPTHHVNYVDPFLFLNHHGPQTYKQNNHGLPFGPHPHRGFETVTFILTGDLAHKDSAGHESVINEGGVQWMTAGSGLIHSEVSSDAFLKKGGPLEILQLWVNLPAKHKMTAPKYVGLQTDKIPHVTVNDGKVVIDLISGTWSQDGKQITGAFHPIVDITLMTLRFQANAELKLQAPKAHNVFFYVVRGEVEVNGKKAKSFELVEFANDSDVIQVKTAADALVLYGHALPFNEPVVSQGPFVMNTREEILKAIQDYQSGKIR